MNKKTGNSIKDNTHKKDSSQFLGALILKTGTCALSILVLLALISYDPEDAHFIHGGLGKYTAVNNWIGLFGAHISYQLIAWLGFASHIGLFLILTCEINRIVNRDLKPFTNVYIAGIAIIIWGTSMLLGVFPNFLSSVSKHLNIDQTPGGVIGQRFCAPISTGESSGWLTWVVNTPGSIIISLCLIAVGLRIIWYFDWESKTELWWTSLMTKLRDRKLNPKPPKKKKEKHDADDDDSETQSHDVEETKKNAKSIIPDPEEFTGMPGRQNSEEKITKSQPARAHFSKTKYKLPPLNLLKEASSQSTAMNPAEIELKKEVLQETLDSFSIDATAGQSTSGPRVTLYEIKPAPGVKVERISSLSNNIAMSLKAESLRILTPIPGKDTVGIEVPNSSSSAVYLRDLFESKTWKNSRDTIPLALGKKINGRPAILDLASAPHLLIAGATGSGKSVCMNTIILSMLYKFTPDELKLIMVDPKVVEFSGYNSLPHLVTPVITQVKKVPIVLRWVLNQMEWRYDVHSKIGVRNIAAFNEKKRDVEILDDEGKPIPERLPYIVVIIDELADIMMTAKADVETSLARIAQLARAVGIHVIVATQRPSVNVITGIIKANFPTRIAFQVTSVVDSRTILDGKGAESLLGKGDALFKPPGGSKLERTQGAMTDDEDIEKVVSYVAGQADAEFIDDILSFGVSKESPSSQGAVSAPADAPPAAAMNNDPEAKDGDEELIQNAIAIILRDRRATTSHVQRRLRIGYNRAALIIEQLEQRGVIGPQVGTAPRQILIDDTGETTTTDVDQSDA